MGLVTGNAVQWIHLPRLGKSLEAGQDLPVENRTSDRQPHHLSRRRRLLRHLRRLCLPVPSTMQNGLYCGQQL